MGTGKNIFLAILGICGLLGGLFLVLLTLGLYPPGIFPFAGRLGRFAGDSSYTLLGALLFIIGAVLFFFSTKSSKKEEGGTIVSFTETGEIRISFRAIESMVLNASRKVKGIREVNTRLNFTEQGLVIYLRIKVIPDVPIPALVNELQGKVREYVQEISGSSVAEVKVLVENIAQEKIEKKVR